MRINKIVDYTEIYKDKEIVKLISQSMFNPNLGKIQNIAEGIYSKQQGIFYTAVIDDHIVGIMGLNRLNPKRVEIMHIAVDEEIGIKNIERDMIYKVKELFSDTRMVIEINDSEVKHYRKLGFSAKKIISDNLRLSHNICMLE